MVLTAQTSRQTILVVEDEPILRMMAVDMVEDAGFHAVAASNSTEAIRILESRLDIVIVFTDIDMPGGIDGMRLAIAIRDRWPPIKIIVTSGNVHVRYAGLPTESVFFEKPYLQEDVVATMHRMAA